MDLGMHAGGWDLGTVSLKESFLRVSCVLIDSNLGLVSNRNGQKRCVQFLPPCCSWVPPLWLYFKVQPQKFLPAGSAHVSQLGPSFVPAVAPCGIRTRVAVGSLLCACSCSLRDLHTCPQLGPFFVPAVALCGIRTRVRSWVAIGNCLRPDCSKSGERPSSLPGGNSCRLKPKASLLGVGGN